MAFPEISEKDEFEKKFSFALSNARGRSFPSLDKIVRLAIELYPESRFSKGELVPVLSDEYNFVLEPFSYIVVKQGKGEIKDTEYLGFKLDREEFFRYGPPHFEPIKEMSSQETSGYRLFESPKKLYELLIHEDIKIQRDI